MSYRMNLQPPKHSETPAAIALEPECSYGCPASAARSSPTRRSPKRIALLTLAVTILNPLGDLCLSWGMKHFNKTVSTNPVDYILAMLHPLVALGVVLLTLWLLMRMALMSVADLTFILPVTALGYALNVLMGKVVLHETVSPQRWGGTFLIVAGAILAGAQYGKSEENSR
jgi:drug/metabolite transporter (DMT)-like permease